MQKRLLMGSTTLERVLRFLEEVSLAVWKGVSSTTTSRVFIVKCLDLKFSMRTAFLHLHLGESVCRRSYIAQILSLLGAWLYYFH